LSVVGSYGFIMQSRRHNDPEIKRLGQEIFDKGTDIDMKLIFDYD